jgi:pimeloyl-ACP methyl ester carboxylesterase
MAEQLARAGEVEIAYETFGGKEDPPLLLVMGLGVQMLGWDTEFCQLLAGHGFRVIRFDNRDVGRSTRFEGQADVMAVVGGDHSTVRYLLSDMASDVVRLLDALEIEAAHVVGASQGGMIAQTMAVEHPERVLSLTSIMSTTGARDVGQPHPEVIPLLLTRPPDDREGYAEYGVRTFREIGSWDLAGSASEERRIRERGRASYDRGFNPDGTGRQLAAIIASGDRSERLREISVPTLVIHGTKDKLVDVSGGKATAEAIPGARLELVEGMGHDLPPPLWERFAELIAENAARAGAPAAN